MIGEIVKVAKFYKDGSFDDLTDNCNYGYLVCECTKTDEAVRVERPKNYTGFVCCTCPRCGRELGIFLESKAALDRGKEVLGDLNDRYGN